MFINAASVTNFVNNVTSLLNRIGYDAELGLLSPVEDLSKWTVGLDLTSQDKSALRRYRFSFQAVPCDTAGEAATISDLHCVIDGPLHGEKHIVDELVAVARAAMMEALNNPEDGAVTACGYAELAKALTWAMVDAGEETVIARFMR